MLHNLNYITIFVPVKRVITYNQYRYDSSTEVEHNKLHWLNFDGNVEPIVNCITGEIVNYDNYSRAFLTKVNDTQYSVINLH